MDSTAENLYIKAFIFLSSSKRLIPKKPSKEDRLKELVEKGISSFYNERPTYKLFAERLSTISSRTSMVIWQDVERVCIPPLTDPALTEIADAVFAEYDKAGTADAEAKSR